MLFIIYSISCKVKANDNLDIIEVDIYIWWVNESLKWDYYKLTKIVFGNQGQKNSS